MEKARAGSESFLHGAFLRAAEIWDVRIGVYNIRRMAGNAIMNGETRYLTKKKPCARWIVGVQFPKNPPCGASIYSVCDFSRNVNAPKVKCSGCFQSAPFLGGCEERESRLLYAAAREKGRSGCFRGVPFLGWLRGAGKPIALCSGAGKGTFRLFPERVGALNACGAFNFAAVLWKFARKSARPPDWFRDAWRKIEGSRPCCFPVRAGGETDEGYSQR